jgi:uncharacterized protein (TIGR02246 family)
MKTITLFFIFVAVLLIAGCAPKAETNKDMALADSLLTVNINAYNSGDAQKIADLFADDALMIVNGKSTWTRDSIYAVAKPMAPVIKNFKAYLGPTSVSKDFIQMQKYFTADIVAGDATLKGKGLATLIWKKQADNFWKIVLEFENYDIKTY